MFIHFLLSPPHAGIIQQQLQSQAILNIKKKNIPKTCRPTLRNKIIEQQWEKSELRGKSISKFSVSSDISTDGKEMFSVRSRESARESECEP